jgi:2-phosphosulfolactate phosphatase
MRSISVCLSPELTQLYDLSDKTVVVVDILRATSCMTTAFAHGVAAIKPIANLEECRALSSRGYITSGERNGEKVEGFDKGNSPFEYMGADIKGKKIAFTTTNGTQAIEKAKGARELLVGSFLNLESVVNYVKASANSVVIICAGWKGRVNLEDSLFAGAVVDALKSEFEIPDDAELMAHQLYIEAKSDMVKFLSRSSHVKRLNRLNIHKDIEFCLTPNQYNVLPKLVNGELIAS